MEKLSEQYPDQVQVVFRHLPLIGTPERPFHDKAALGAQAAEAAGLQGQFWEMHDLLFAKQGEWASLVPEEFQSWLLEQADSLGLKVTQFEKDLTSEALVKAANDAWGFAQANGMTFTPLVLVNNQPWPSSLPISLENLAAIVELEMLKDRQFSTCPPMEVDQDQQYFAILNTEKGEIVIELYPDKAPLAVNSFIFLAEHDWFDGVTFHRVLPGFVAQAGDPTRTGFGGPGYAFASEISEDLKFDSEGVVAMANSGPDTNGSQFFITLGPAERLNGGYTIFGHVIDGMDVVKMLTPRDPSASMNLPSGDKILNVVIDEK
jgi:cyclophilin family peptidyl-prolyl cis-trans isomerase